MKTLTQEQTEALIEKAVHAAFDAGCKMIQDALGVTTGDLAGMHFSGGENTWRLASILREYLEAEVRDGRNSGRIVEIAGAGPQWTAEHGEAADREGWGIFCHNADESDPHIERDDEADLLESDGAACALVLAGTEAHHVAAREYIKHRCPANFALMEEHARTWRDPQAPTLLADNARVIASSRDDRHRVYLMIAGNVYTLDNGDLMSGPVYADGTHAMYPDGEFCAVEIGALEPMERTACEDALRALRAAYLALS